MKFCVLASILISALVHSYPNSTNPAFAKLGKRVSSRSLQHNPEFQSGGKRAFTTKMFGYRPQYSSNDELVDSFIRDGSITSDVVANALRKTDRIHFVPKTDERFAYVDSPLPLSEGQTISAPHMHAHALQLLHDVIIGDDKKVVLDVGSGSGYFCAAMANLNPKAEVYGIDIHESLVRTSSENLHKFDSLNGNSLKDRVHISQGSGWDGLVDIAPFDAIHVGAAAASLPKNLCLQMKVNAKMVIPIGPEGGAQILYLVTRKKNSGDLNKDMEMKELLAVQYVPLVTGRRAPVSSSFHKEL